VFQDESGAADSASVQRHPLSDGVPHHIIDLEAEHERGTASAAPCCAA
jgi:hypothetical protein